MEAKLTVTSPSLGGDVYESVSAKSQNPAVFSSRKISVFISSKCGDEKYNKIRKELKLLIESTGLAQVYLFEDEEAATVTAGHHYIYALEDSDVCIFLIDNADGIPTGVQAEVDAVKKNNIKAIYYFCDERSTEKTWLEKSLLGADFAKSKTVHSFADLSKNGARALIDDIVLIYHSYCKGRLDFPRNEKAIDQTIHISDIEKVQLPVVPKIVLNNVDLCKDHILKLVTSHNWNLKSDETIHSNDIDLWCDRFLEILFEGKNISQFDMKMFLSVLKQYQTEEYYHVVEIRWNAIHSYFSNNVEQCVNYLNDALELAKSTNCPMWIINDILIDQRNQHLNLCAINNQYTESKAQQELDESDDKVYYPILDRIYESIREKYMDGLYKEKIKSPYTVTYGNDLNEYGELLASAYVVAIYNGSLTHILLIYDELKRFLFYLSCKYDNWKFKLNLYKFSVFTGKQSEVEGVRDSYPEVINKLTSQNAEEIMNFCGCQPVEYQRLEAQLRAFGAIGYYLTDDCFQLYQDKIVTQIRTWIFSNNPIVDVGHNVFSGLSGVAQRISQDILSDICCWFMDQQFRLFYTEMFRFVGRYIKLQKMHETKAKALVEHICGLFDNENDRKSIEFSPMFLSVLCKQDSVVTKCLDDKVSQYFPEYYKSEYRLQLSENKNDNYSEVIRDYVGRIKQDNETQGQNGRFFGHGIRFIARIRLMLLSEKYVCEDEDLLDSIITTVANTLLRSKEDISTKLDAVSLLCCLIVKYKKAYLRNQKTYEELLQDEEKIYDNEFPLIVSNVDVLALRIGVQFLFVLMGKDKYAEILELMPYIQGNAASIITVSRQITEYLEISNRIILPDKIEGVVLQNVLQWLNSNHTDIRWYATAVLLLLCRTPDNRNVINHTIVGLMDSENMPIKKLIVQSIYETEGVTEETKQYVISKCENDPNYIVRMACLRERETHRNSKSKP